MKELKTFMMLILFLSAQPLFVACGGDDDATDSGNQQVTIGDDGKASNGGVFSSIDDKNFYLDYIKYTVKEGHLAVSGYDKSGFKGVAKIVSSITYKGNFYEVLEISDKAFSYCDVLVSVSIPTCVTKIGSYAFYNCNSLSSMDIKDLSAWCKISFYNYASNPLLFVHHLYVNGKEVKDLVIPTEVTSISSYAFTGCRYLNSITIHKNVTSIGRSAFIYCGGLTNIIVEDGNSNYDSRGNCNAIIQKSTNALLVGCSKTVIPDDVTSIEADAFKGCERLESLTIPTNVTSIGSEAFSGCKGLASLRIEDTTQKLEANGIGLSASLTTLYIGRDVTFHSGDDNYSPFSHKNRLTSLTFGSGFTRIPPYTFWGCSSLTSLTFPSQITSIGGDAFYDCNEITTIHCLGTTPPQVLSLPFMDTVYKTATLYVPRGSVEAYKNMYAWGRFNNIIEE